MGKKGKPFYGYSRTVEVGVAATNTASALDVPLWSAPFACKVTGCYIIPATTLTGASTDNCTISVVNKGTTGTLSDNIATLTYDNGVDAATVSSVWGVELTRAIVDISKYYNKPITVCLNVPSQLTHTEINALDEHHIPTYPFPERAVSGLAGLVRYGEILKAIG